MNNLKPEFVQAGAISQIRLADEYNLYCDGKPVGYFQCRVIRHAGNPKINTWWKLTCSATKKDFNYRVFNTGLVRQCFIPEPYDCLGQLSELGCQEMTVDGIERSVFEGGGCTSMYVKRGSEEGEVFDIDPNKLSITIPTRINFRPRRHPI